MEGVTIFDCCFTPNSEYLYSCSNFGRVTYWNLASYLQRNAQEVTGESTSSKRDGGSFQAHNNSIYSMISFNDLIITGADEEIRGWKNPHSEKDTIVPEFEIVTPQLEGLKGSRLPVAETNGLALNPSKKLLFAATGDGNAYSWDLETKKLINTFEGHRDYLHCITTVTGANLIATGSEDGTFKFWDVRTKNSVATLEFKNNPGQNSIVTCCSVDKGENFLVFAGQDTSGKGRIQACHIASRVLAQDSSTQMSCVQCVEFLSMGKLVCAGDSMDVEFRSSDLSQLHAKVKSSSQSVFALCNSEESTGLMIVSGASPYVDICLEETRTHMFSLYFGSS